jgi:hypothetical protein
MILFSLSVGVKDNRNFLLRKTGSFAALSESSRQLATNELKLSRPFQNPLAAFDRQFD